MIGILRLPRVRFLWLAGLLMTALGPATQARAADAPLSVDPTVRAGEADRVKTIREITPAVVAVCKFGGQASGSGVIIDPEGYALTNFHVVSDTGPVMSCGLSDHQLYDAVLVGLDRVGDVALIKLLPREKDKPFAHVRLGDSDTVKIGDWSLALGNPFGVALDFVPTVTYGLVSGTNRYQPPAGNGFLEYTDCIQVDTSINPGNSGGPLFNMKGELIGINGRISLEKRGRVNVGVGYAISINQIKNFLGHMYAGIDTDHATLGATVGTADEDKELNKVVVQEVLPRSDADRRGLQDGDRLIRFGTTGRFMTTTNQFKNILGIYPGGWRVPLTYKRGSEPEREILVRLQGLMPRVKTEGGDEETKGPPPLLRGSTPGSEAAPLYKPRQGFANWYFNEVEQGRLLEGLKKHGDFTAVPGTWSAEGSYAIGARKGDMRFEVSETQGEDSSPLVILKLNFPQKLQPLTADTRDRAEPIGSGGLMMALYHWHRFLTLGPKGFEGARAFEHLGSEPFYPRPADDSQPKSLAAIRVDADVIRTKYGSVECKWYFGKKDRLLLGFETFLSKDDDPCEVYFSDYKAVDNRMLPHRIEARKGDGRYGVLTVSRYNLQAK